MAADIRYNVTAKDKSKAVLKKSEKNIESLSKTVSDIGGTLKKAFAIGATIVVLKKLSAVVKDLTGAYGEQLQAERRLEQAVQNNPLLNGDSVDRLADYAGALQKVSTFGDEAIIQQQAMAAAMGFSEEQIRAISSAAIDYAAGAGVSLESAFKNLGKTLSGMQGELGESIPALRELTQEQLKAGEGIEVVAEAYKGMAQVIAETPLGTLQQLNGLVGDLKEVGGELLANFLNPSVVKLKEFAEGMLEVNEQIEYGAFVTQGLAEQTLTKPELEAALERTKELMIGISDEAESLRKRSPAQFRVLLKTFEQLNDRAIDLERQINNINVAREHGRAPSEASLIAEQERIIQAEKDRLLLLNQLSIGQLAFNSSLDLQNKIINDALSPMEQQRNAYRGLIDELALYRTALVESGFGRGSTLWEENQGMIDWFDALADNLDLAIEKAELFEVALAGVDAAYAKAAELTEAGLIFKDGGAPVSGPVFGPEEAPAGGMPAFSPIISAALPDISFEEQFGDAFGELVTGSGELVSTFDALTGSSTSMAGGFSGILIQIAQSLMSYKSINAILNPLSTILASMKKVLEPAVNDVLKPLVGILGIVGQTFGKMLIPVFQALSPIIEGVGKLFTDWFNKIVPLINIFTDLWIVIGGIVDTLINVVDLILEPFRWMGDQIAFFMGKLKADLINAFIILDKNKVENLIADPGKLDDRMDTLVDNFGTIWEEVASDLLDPSLHAQRIGLEDLQDAGEAVIAEGGAAGAQFVQGRPLNVSITVNTEAIVGEEGFQQFAVMIEREIREAEALGIV